MVQNEHLEIFLSIVKAAKEIILSGAGGIVAYMYSFLRQSKDDSSYAWSNRTLLINMCIGSFVGYTIGSFIPLDYAYRDGLIGFSGVSAYTIIGLIESRFAVWMVEKITGTKVQIEGHKNADE